jgi:uncharacterized protein YlaI
MTKIEDLKASVEKATEKVEKIKNTIAKHEAAAAKKLAALAKLGITAENMEEKKWDGGVAGTGGSAHYWEICEVESKLDDAKSARKKLRDAEAILANWQAKLDVEVEKDRFLSENAPAVIVEFLNQWKEMARDWHIKAVDKYLELKPQLAIAEKEAKAKFLAENPGKSTWSNACQDAVKKDTEVRNISGKIASLGGFVATLATYRDEAERAIKLERELEADRKSKLIDLINRINAVVGSITDAQYLRVSEKGNLDGIIVGEKGKAKIETIGAGGYNIQCFHFRTLVHEVK